MVDILGSLSAALAIASKVKIVSKHVRDADFKNLLADLNIKLAEAKMKMGDLLEENVRLKERIRELEKVEGDRCPRCHKMTWLLDSSKPDDISVTWAGTGELTGARLAALPRARSHTN